MNKDLINYNEKQAREIINSYLYYGYGMKLFLEQNYPCMQYITIDRLKKLWIEQVEIMGNCEE